MQDEKIQNLERKINEFESKKNNNINSINLNSEIKCIKKIPSGKTITCHNKFDGVNYYLGSYRYFVEEKINDKRNKISGYYDKHIGQNWTFYEISEGNYSLTYADNFHDLLNWKIYSDVHEVVLSKEKSSLYTLLTVEGKENENCFYIQDSNSKRFLYLTYNYRNGGGFFIGFSYRIIQEEKERFIFYYS